MINPIIHTCHNISNSMYKARYGETVSQCAERVLRECKLLHGLNQTVHVISINFLHKKGGYNIYSVKTNINLSYIIKVITRISTL